MLHMLSSCMHTSHEHLLRRILHGIIGMQIDDAILHPVDELAWAWQFMIMPTFWHDLCDIPDCKLREQFIQFSAICKKLQLLTGAVDKLGVLRMSLNERADICAADVALVDGKESLSCLGVVLSQEPLEVLEAL